MAIGDIGPLIDVLEWELVVGNMPSFCHVSGDVYAAAYFGPLSDGWVCTFSIDSTGNISAAIIDSWEFDAVFGSYPEIVKVYETVYAIAYTDTNTFGQLITFHIANDGTITKSTIDNGRYSAALSTAYQILKIADNVFAILFNDRLAHGWIQMVGINNLGTILSLDIDKTEFDAVKAIDSQVIHISGPVYAIVYTGPGDDGWLITLSINNSGTITNPSIDTLEFETAQCNWPSIAKARDDFFPIAYAGPGGDGWMKVVEIDISGNITDPPVDSYEFDIYWGTYPSLLAIGAGYVALSYLKTGNPLWLATFQVDAAGSLNDTTLDSAQIDPGSCSYSILYYLAGNYYSIVYTGPGGGGWVRTITIDTPVLAKKQHLMIIGVG